MYVGRGFQTAGPSLRIQLATLRGAQCWLGLPAAMPSSVYTDGRDKGVRFGHSRRALLH